ncbi:MAG: RluA family pseudouridine synthase [Lutisporaceae bacterium]
MKKEIKIKIESEKLNIKDYLEQQCSFSSRKIKALLKNKRVLINGKVAYWDNSIKNEDILIIDLSETGKDSTIPEDMSIEVIYEDEYFLAVNKSAGMLVHPTQNHPNGTLANGIKHYFINKGLDIPIRFANRIDMDTSGIVVLAKSGEAHAKLSAQFDQAGCEKYYVALAEGTFMVKNGSIDKPIGIDEENPIRRAVREGGQRSITQYEVLEQYALAALLRLKLMTGRTHQIRVHLSSLGHPLLGDKLYGGKDELIARQALHACEMVFTHPFGKEIIRLEAPLPDDMKKLINKFKNS